MTNSSEDWYVEHASAKTKAANAQGTCDISAGPLSSALNVVVLQDKSEINDHMNLLTCTLFGKPVIRGDVQDSRDAQDAQDSRDAQDAHGVKEAQTTQNATHRSEKTQGFEIPFSESTLVFAQKDEPHTSGAKGVLGAHAAGEITHVTWENGVETTRQDAQAITKTQKTLDVLAYRDLFIFRIMNSWSALDKAAEDPFALKDYALSNNQMQSNQILALQGRINQVNDRISYLKRAKEKLNEIDLRISDTDKQIENVQNIKPETLLKNGDEVSNRLLGASEKEIDAIEKSLDDLSTRNKKQQEQMIQARAEYEEADEKLAEKKSDAEADRSDIMYAGNNKIRKGFTIACATIAFILTVFSIFLVVTQSIDESNQLVFQGTFSAAFVFCLIAIIAVFANRRAFERKVTEEVESAKGDFKKKKTEYEVARKAYDQNEKDVVMKLKVMGLEQANGDLSRAKELMSESRATRGEYVKKSNGVSDLRDIMLKEQVQNFQQRASLVEEIKSGVLWSCDKSASQNLGNNEGTDANIDFNASVDIDSEIALLYERRAVLELCVKLRKNLAGMEYGARVQDHVNENELDLTSIGAYEDIFADYFQSRIGLLRSVDFVGKHVPVMFDNFLDCLGESSQKQAVGILAGLSKSQQVVLYTCSKDVAKLVKSECKACNVVR